MTTYRLPDGTEVPPAAVPGLPKPDFYIWIEHPTLGSIAVDSALVTEVKPLPPEPPIGTVVLDGGDRAWQRVRDYQDPPWRHDSLMCSWETMVQDHGPLTVLKPDPADDAPALPWTLDSCRRSASVGTPKHGTVVVDVPGIDYTPGELEQIARALLAAARAAREVETP